MASLIGLAHFAFIGGSAAIYITQIGLSSQVYSYFFALNALVGAFSMWLIALDWSDKIGTIGILGAGSGGLVLGLWLMLPKLAAPKR